MPSQTRQYIAIAVGLAGVACALLLVMIGDTRDLRFVWGDAFVVVLLAGPSAWIAGFAVAGGLGHDGAGGWVMSYVASILATLMGAMIAGTFLLPGLGTLFAPATLIANFLATPPLGVAWAAIIAALHYFSMKLRAEEVSKA